MTNQDRIDAQIRFSFSIGKRLQDFRKNAGLSQRELARRAGMTNSTLSMIEQDKVSPSVVSLEKILSAIPVSLNAFFSQSEPYSTIKKNNRLFCLKGDGYELRSLPLEYFRGARSWFRICLFEAAQTNPCSNESNSFNAGMLMSGEVNLVINGKKNHLEAGDAFEFSHACEFFFENAFASTAELSFLGDSSVFEHITQGSLI